MSEKPVCSVCGEPMEEIESMFKFHGSIGPCPKPPLKKSDATFVYRFTTQTGCDAEFVSKEAYDALAKRVAELERIHQGCSLLAIRLDAAQEREKNLVAALEDALHQVYDGSAPDKEVDQWIADELKTHRGEDVDE